MDYEEITAPCGLPCFACGLYKARGNPDKQKKIAEALGIPVERAVCAGCREQEGRCIHNTTPCRVYPCAQERGVRFCFECADFPCDYLHPYADKANVVPHNQKVFNLCLIKKMGLREWAESKAESVYKTYFFEEWKL